MRCKDLGILIPCWSGTSFSLFTCGNSWASTVRDEPRKVKGVVVALRSTILLFCIDVRHLGCQLVVARIIRIDRLGDLCACTHTIQWQPCKPLPWRTYHLASRDQPSAH